MEGVLTNQDMWILLLPPLTLMLLFLGADHSKVKGFGFSNHWLNACWGLWFFCLGIWYFASETVHVLSSFSLYVMSTPAILMMLRIYGKKVSDWLDSQES